MDRETRCFDPERYQLSFHLPEIIQSLPTRYIQQTGRGNFFTVEATDIDGKAQEYEIYFRLTKPGKKQNLKLFIESAYVRHTPDLYRNKKKRIRFFYYPLQNQTR